MAAARALTGSTRGRILHHPSLGQQAQQVFDPAQIIAIQELIRRMPVGQNTVDFILQLVLALRPEDHSASDQVKDAVAWGPGTRAAQALILMCRAHALLSGHLAPSVSDVISVSQSVLAHRMSLRFSAQAQGLTVHQLILDTIDSLDRKGAAA